MCNVYAFESSSNVNLPTDHSGVGCMDERVVPRQMHGVTKWSWRVKGMNRGCSDISSKHYLFQYVLGTWKTNTFSMLEKYLFLGYSFIKSQLTPLWTNHLFHKDHWCHVIDTIIQLYMIVGLGIWLKSIVSVRSWRWTSLCLPRNLHIAVRVLLKRAN